MHTFALARRFSGTQIAANCLHPGVIATNLLPRWLRVVKPLISQMIEPEQAARTCMYLALASDLSRTSGCYFDEHRTVQPASQLASNVESQELLWNTSARWTDNWTSNFPSAIKHQSADSHRLLVSRQNLL
jgi:NAD(P)-dependent dehydrogenase (short-subunit alcohol dehydrogenase family)